MRDAQRLFVLVETGVRTDASGGVSAKFERAGLSVSRFVRPLPLPATPAPWQD